MYSVVLNCLSASSRVAGTYLVRSPVQQLYVRRLRRSTELDWLARPRAPNNPMGSVPRLCQAWSMTAPLAGILFPRDLLQPRRVDEHFRPEAAAARDLDLGVQLIDHDAVVAGDIQGGLSAIAPADGAYLYRGWVIPPSQYGSMAQACTERGVLLVTSGDAFASAHHLPRWYPAMSAATPESAWTESDDLDDLLSVIDQFAGGPLVIKDFSKSEKHYWDEAMFIPDATDRMHARAVATRFLELRGSAFDTGFVVRRFEPLDTTEARTWWRDGRCVLVTPHPDTPDDAPPEPDLDALTPLVACLSLPFVAVDIATNDDTGALRVVELGDGQVSDRPPSTDPTVFISSLR